MEIWVLYVLFATEVLLLFYFGGVQLLHNIVLISAIQQSESAIHIHTSPLFLF